MLNQPRVEWRPAAPVLHATPIANSYRKGGFADQVNAAIARNSGRTSPTSARGPSKDAFQSVSEPPGLYRAPYATITAPPPPPQTHDKARVAGGGSASASVALISASEWVPAGYELVSAMRNENTRIWRKCAGKQPGETPRYFREPVRRFPYEPRPCRERGPETSTSETWTSETSTSDPEPNPGFSEFGGRPLCSLATLFLGFWT